MHAAPISPPPGPCPPRKSGERDDVLDDVREAVSTTPARLERWLKTEGPWRCSLMIRGRDPLS